MKVQHKQVVIERDGIDENDDGAFTIEFNDKAASILADGLYKDKPLAIVRELCCNARDSMVDSGKGDQPFRVHLPNHMEPWFSVEDDGLGMSQEFAMHTFTRFFSSTKTNSNNTVGQLGLGSKSPFSMVDSYVVETRYDGVLTTWTAYRGELGIPRFAKMSESPTDRPNGVMINLAVPSSRFREFYSAAKRVLTYFDPIPEVVGAEIEIKAPEYVLKTDKYGVRVYSSSDTFNAVMGGVAYPIDIAMFSISQHTWRAVDLFFEIGDLEVIASREGLQYTEQVKRNIAARIEEVEHDIREKVTSDVLKAETRFEACIEMAKAPKFARNFMHSVQYKFRNKTYEVINSEISIKPFIDRLSKHLEIETVEVRGTRTSRRGWPSYSAALVYPSASIVIWDDLPSKDRSLSSRIREAYPNKQVIVVRPTSKSGIARYRVACGRAPESFLIKASSLSKPETTPNKKTNVFKVNMAGGYSKLYEQDFIKTDMKFSEVKNFVRVSNYQLVNSEGVAYDRSVSLLKQIENLIPGSTTNLVAVRNGDVKSLPATAVELIPYAVEEFCKKYESGIRYNQIQNCTQNIQSRYDGFRSLFSTDLGYPSFREAAIWKEKTGLAELIPEVVQANNYTGTSLVPDNLNLISALVPKDRIQIGFDPDEIIERILNRYPMLGYCRFDWYSDKCRTNNQKVVLDYVKLIDASMKP